MSDPSPQPTVPANPFVGPAYFVEGQVLHGRRRETQALTDLLIGKRVVLLISPSGAGKTSLIRAALLPRLRTRLNPLPIVRFGCSPDARGPGVNRYVLSTLCAMESALPEGERLPFEALAGYTLAGYLTDRAARVTGESGARFKLLVLDQFEELFTLDRLDWADKEVFLGQLGEALSGGTQDPDPDDDPDGDAPEQSPPLWALVSMREDYVAELEPFLHLIPTGFGYRYRLEALEREQAIEAATATAGDFFPRAAVEPLVDDLRLLAAGPVGGEERLGRFVEPVQLQVVCLRLWDEVVAGQGRPIRADDIASDGQGNAVNTALAGYYDGAVEEAAAAAGVQGRELRDWVEARLISRSKMRTRVLREPGPLDKALAMLVERYLLRVDLAGDREWFELSHDRLVEPVLASNERWRVQNLAVFQRQVKLWAESDRPDEMLFSGDELAEALEFADRHPEGLSDDDKVFLERSRGMRDQAEAELERNRKIAKQAREINIKNQEILAKNRRLRTWRFWLSGLGIVASVACGVALYFLVDNRNKTAKLVEANIEIVKANIRLANGNLYGRLKRTVATARGSAIAELYAELGSIAEEIQPKQHLAFLQQGLVQGLIEVLGSHAPTEQRLGDHDHIVRALRFSADGQHLYSVGWDGRLKSWSVDGSSSKASMHGDHQSDIRSLAYHAGRQLLVSTDNAGSILLWTVQDGSPRLLRDLKQVQAAHTGAVWTAAFSPDGLQLATGGRDKQIQFWDLADTERPAYLGPLSTRFHETGIYRLAYIEQGPYRNALVSADWNGWVGVWCAPGSGGDEPLEPELALFARDTVDRAVGIFGLAISPDGRWIAVGDHRGGVRAWDLGANDQAEMERRFPYFDSHRSKVIDMAFSDDSSTLVTVGSDGVLLSWSMPSVAKTPQEFYEAIGVKRFEGWGEKLYSVAFLPGSSRRIAVGGARSIWLADLSRSNPLATPIEVSGQAATRWSAIAATPDLAALAALEQGGQLYRWRWDGEAYRALPPIEPGETLDRIALAPDGTSLGGLSCKTGKLLLYSFAQDPAPVPQVFDELEGDVRPDLGDGDKECVIAFAPGGRSFATGVDRNLRLWSRTQSGDWRGTQPQQIPGPLLALAFSPHGGRLAGAGRFERLLVWDIANGQLAGQPAQSMESLGEAVSVLAFDPTGQVLISGGEDALVTTWAPPGLRKGSQSQAHDRRLTALAVAQRAGVPVFVSGDAEGQIVLCVKAIEDRQCKHIGRPSKRGILGLAASTDLSRLIVADEGGGLWVWDLRRQSMLESIESLSR